MKSRKYWFDFDLSLSDRHAIGTLMGTGVTASSKEEALELVRKRVFRSQRMPSVVKCIEDVDISQLDPNHVLPNIGDDLLRGIWFPLGYDSGDDNLFAES